MQKIDINKANLCFPEIANLDFSEIANLDFPEIAILNFPDILKQIADKLSFENEKQMLKAVLKEDSCIKIYMAYGQDSNGFITYTEYYRNKAKAEKWLNSLHKYYQQNEHFIITDRISSFTLGIPNGNGNYKTFGIKEKALIL